MLFSSHGQGTTKDYIPCPRESWAEEEEETYISEFYILLASLLKVLVRF